MTADSSVAPTRSRLTIPSGEPLLRLVLKLDAAVTGANGAAYLALGGILDSALGLPSPLLRAVGAFLLAFAAFVWLIATRPTIRPAAAGTIVAANASWALGSVAMAIFDWFSPSVAGSVWIALQAVVVASLRSCRAWRRRATDSRPYQVLSRTWAMAGAARASSSGVGAT